MKNFQSSPSLSSMMKKHPQSSLPPGFRFHPTDEELILHYLRNKIASSPLPVSIITEVDIYKFDPWDLPAIAAFGEKEWYFFTPRDRKYPNGARPNRAAASGYWKATGTDKTIVASMGGGGAQNVGVKKALVFYKGRPPKGTKTNWIMHEYRLAEALQQHQHHNNYTNKAAAANKLKDLSMRLDDWVLCRIYKKCHASVPTSSDAEQEEEEEKLLQESLDLASQNMKMNGVFPQKSSSFSNLLDAMDYSLLSSFLSENSTHLNLNPSASGFDMEQPSLAFFNNTNNNTYFAEKNKLPDLTSSIPNISNKRNNPSIGHQDTSNPSKRLNMTTTFTNNHQFEPNNVNNNLLKQTFLNQHLLMNPFNIHFQ